MVESGASYKTTDATTPKQRGTYVFLALFPLTGWGIHLWYLGRVGCGGVMLLYLFLPFVWLFHGLPSGVHWLLSSDAEWAAHLASLPEAQPSPPPVAPPEPADPERQRRMEEARRAAERERAAEERAAKAQQARDEAMRRDQALAEDRLQDLADFYGGKERYVELVRKGMICIGMTSAAVKASWGEPGDVKEDISAKRRRTRLFYVKRVGARGKVSYRHEIILLNDRVVEMKDR